MLLLSCSTEDPELLTFRVMEIPDDTPAGDTIYLAGSFNDWNPSDPAYTLKENGQGDLELSFEAAPGNLKYKFTRGSWDRVEGGSEGQDIADRSLTYKGGGGLVEVRILTWRDLVLHETTAAENVRIMSEDFDIPQLDRHRRIWVYLPPDYEKSEASYPVLYMQDGQNLFDKHTSFVGEWEIDESLNELFENGDRGIIVVGVDHGSNYRLDEYSPWLNAEYGGGDGEAYGLFLVETLKPYIDQHFRTMPGREHTGVMGSSMGGFISHYLAVEYQDIFSKAGIFSPSYWFSEELYSHTLNTGKQEEMRFYIMGSRNESPDLEERMNIMKNALQEAGFGEEEIKLLVHSDGGHSEYYWRREFPEAYLWLYDKNRP